MNKVRVYDLAKKLGKSNPEMVEILKRMGVDIRNHMSSIDGETAQQVEDVCAALFDQPQRGRRGDDIAQLEEHGRVDGDGQWIVGRCRACLRRHGGFLRHGGSFRWGCANLPARNDKGLRQNVSALGGDRQRSADLLARRG